MNERPCHFLQESPCLSLTQVLQVLGPEAPAPLTLDDEKEQNWEQPHVLLAWLVSLVLSKCQLPSRKLN